MTPRTGLSSLLLCVALAAAGCGTASRAAAPAAGDVSGSVSPSATPDAPATPIASATATPSSAPRRVHATAAPTRAALACDPRGGSPRSGPGCPDPEPDTGWVRAVGAHLVLQPFRTYVSDDEGREYARAHGLGFPFPDDYLDVPVGRPRILELDGRTTCTASIAVDWKGGIQDHAVSCDRFRDVARRQPVAAAVWMKDGRVFQLSELYRP